ncbi:MAG TPA: MarR family winged helix-turn-helix transcriptional regulator [Terracidiphilus sp.]
MSKLKAEISQETPFSGPHEEVLLNLIRTTDCLQRALQQTTRRWKITSTQYNVLRILRGAHPAGLPCSMIGDRMLTADPDVTRLVSRLKAAELVRQERDKKDRRVVLTHISQKGLELLGEMDEAVSRFPAEMLSHLGDTDLRSLITLLERARAQCDSRLSPTCNGTVHPGPVTCDGAPKASERE